MITKELLSEVLGYIPTRFKVDENEIKIVSNEKFDRNCGMVFDQENINIHELAHKCKQWAKSIVIDGIECVLYSAPQESKSTLKYVCHIGSPFEFDFDVHWFKTSKADTEPEAIFKACQWILDNKDK